MGLGSAGSTGSFVPKFQRLVHPLASTVGVNALLHSFASQPGDNRKCDHSSHFAMHIQHTQLKSDLRVVSEVVSVWFYILLTWFVFSCGF